MTIQDIKTVIKAAANTAIRIEKVAMLHPGRCGSTVLGDLMNQNKNIFWWGEPFEKLMKKGRSLSSEKVVSVIRQAEATRISRVFSFATKYPKDMHLSKDCINMEIPEYIKLLVKMGYTKFIVINRSNHLKRAISMENGRLSNQWHVTTNVSEARKVKVDPASLMVGFDYYLPLTNYFQLLDEEHSQILSELEDLDHICLNYEKDIETDPLKAYKDVIEFLKLAYTKPEVKLKKTNPFPVSQTLLNYQEVREALMNTPYAWMLDE